MIAVPTPSSANDNSVNISENNPLKPRYVLPNATATSMVASLNLRELIHLANLRLCTRAQKEIRILVKRMCDELTKEEEWLKDYLVPKCERLGYCDEDKSCGRKTVRM